MLPHCLPCRDSRGAATLPHRLPLRSIPPPRFASGSSHSRGHGRPRSVRKSSRLRWKCLSKDCICSGRRKSLGPSAPIAYATYVSPPDEAVAWPGRRCWIQDMAATWPVRRSSKSPRARIPVLGTSGAQWPARWPRFELTERVYKS